MVVTNLDELKKKIVRRQHQRQTFSDIYFVVKDYWPQSRYVLKKFGFRQWFNFWFTKFFVADEGGEFDFFAPIIKRFPSILKSPFKIEIEHTTICNKKCIYCAHTHWEEKQQQMLLVDFKNLINSVRSLRWVNLAGIGSFFLNKDSINMLKYARKKHLNINFVDEFDYFTEEHARTIIELGVNSIYVSFDGVTPQTYESIKKGCSFDRSLNNIRMLLDMKKKMNSPLPVLHFRYLISKHNYHEMPEYIDLVASLNDRGVRARIEFIGLIVFEGIEQYYMPLDTIPEEIIEQVYKRSFKYNINLYFNHAQQILPPMSNCVRWTEPFVLVNGDVIADCAILMQGSFRRAYLDMISFGNAFDKPFGELWNSKHYTQFRKSVAKRTGKIPRSCHGCCVFDVKTRESRYGIETI